jgi:uncharacterized RDD family membrane protein YckC
MAGALSWVARRKAAKDQNAPPADPNAPLTREFVTPEGVDLRLQLGSAGERAGAFLLDMVILFVAMLAILIVVGFAGAQLRRGGDSAGEFMFILTVIAIFLLRNFYFVFFELRPRAATPGKMALGLRVAARDGGRLTSEAIFTRNAMREIEVFLPLNFLLVAWVQSFGQGDSVDSWLVLLALVWTGIFALFPLFNRDKLRVGDFMAGTWVVKAPRRVLAVDLASDAPERLVRFAFTPEQTAAYGVKELQVLEDVLRRRDARTMAAVAERIRGKIGWARGPAEGDPDFLAAYYAALRGRLENRLLFGHRRKDKYDKA